MRFSKLLLRTLLLVLSLGVSVANAVEIKIATLVPNQSQWMQDMRTAVKVIEERTSGRVKLKFYGGGTQGTEQAILRKIRIGQLHGGTFSPTDFMKQYSDINIYGIPFAFETWDEIRMSNPWPMSARRNIQLLSLTLVAILASTAGSAADYYVDNTVPTSGSGSIDSPFKTIQEGIDRLAPGDIVWIRNVSRGEPPSKVASRCGVSNAISHKQLTASVGKGQ